MMNDDKLYILAANNCINASGEKKWE